MNDAYTASANYPYFMGLFCCGCFFIFLAFCFLPVIVIAPRKTANLMNVGSIMILISFGLIKGYYKFFVEDLLCNKQKGFFAWTYVLSVITTIYASMIIKSYVLTLIALGVEIVCLLYFTCSYFPGGNTGFKYMLKALWAMTKGMFSLCMKCCS